MIEEKGHLPCGVSMDKIECNPVTGSYESPTEFAPSQKRFPVLEETARDQFSELLGADKPLKVQHVSPTCVNEELLLVGLLSLHAFRSLSLIILPTKYFS
jgi:hypothetical protein